MLEPGLLVRLAPRGFLGRLGAVGAAGGGLEAPRARVAAGEGAGAELLDHQHRVAPRVVGQHRHRVAAGEDAAADDLGHGAVEAAVAEAMLLDAEIVGVGEVARERLDVGGGVRGAEDDGQAAVRAARPAEGADADAVEEEGHVRRPSAGRSDP